MITVTVLWIIIFIAIALFDWKYHRIPNAVMFICCIGAIMLLCFDSFTDADIYTRQFIPSNSLINGLICAVVMGGMFALAASIQYGFMGMGDVKLIILIGLVLGFPLIVYAVLVSALVSFVAIWIMLRRGKKDMKSMLPLGAFLSVGAIVALLLPDSFVRMVF